MALTIEQKVVTILNFDDTLINDEITTQNSDNWYVVSLILSGTDIIILFTRTTQSA